MKPFIMTVMKNIQHLEKALFEDQGPFYPNHVLPWFCDKFWGITAKSEGSVCLGSQEIMVQLRRDDYDPGGFLGIN